MKEGYCEKCGKEIHGIYASFGGCFSTHVKSKEYHLDCIPTLQVLRETIEEQLDEIFRTLEPVVGSGWERKQDEGDLEVFVLRVPKRLGAS